MFDDNDYVCKHLQLTKGDLVRVIREKQLTTFEQIQDETDAGTVCGTCVPEIEAILEEELKKRE
ncbi:(2Fe-2S)-binding protein [Marinilabiliaceae bacterium JC017]|nr:(2Fe-2S)-binding protein [Marinilabiliaceae bacterium JC017]